MVFEDLFLESGGRPVEFKGRVVQLVDHFPLGPTGGVRLSFKAADSEYRQGVLLRLKRGSFFVNEIRTKGPLVLWHDTAPPSVEVLVESSDPSVEVRNVWDTGDGVMQSWHSGAAMMVEQLSDGRRVYWCNDGVPDEDFDDVIFEVEQLEATSK